MATILLALGDSALRDACRAQLEAAGHAPVLLDRPLASLSLARKLSWHAVCLDASDLGRETLTTLATAVPGRSALVGLGFDAPGLAASVPLPLEASRLLAAIDALTTPGVPAPGLSAGSLTLDSRTRSARSDGREVALTRTEFRLLETLLEHQPNEVALHDLLESVWGFSEGRGTSDLIRAHIRNLRTKLAAIGLADAVRSRRGHGYAMVVV